MNRNDFISMLDETTPVNRQLLGEVNDLVTIFPYFQSARLLQLKGLQQNADVKFENQLKQSAVYIADREVLYYLLKEDPQKGDVTEKKRGKVIAVEDNSIDNQQTVIETARNSEQFISEIERDSSDIIPGREEEGEDKQGHRVLISSEPDENGDSGIMILLDEKASPDDEKVFYMDPGFSLPVSTDLLELDNENTGRDLSAEEGTKEKDKTDDLTGRQTQSELIDKFIDANPRIEPVRDKKDLSAGEIFQDDDNDDDVSFVTETLARIYINQGYYSKAIDIYERLSLKFPGKSSYFASQIEKVKDLIK